MDAKVGIVGPSNAVLGLKSSFEASPGAMESDGKGRGGTCEDFGRFAVVESVPRHQAEQFPIVGAEPSQRGHHHGSIGDGLQWLGGHVGLRADVDKTLGESMLATPTPPLSCQRSTGHCEQPRAGRVRDVVQPAPGNEEGVGNRIFGRFGVDPSQCIAEDGVDVVGEQLFEALHCAAWCHVSAW